MVDNAARAYHAERLAFRVLKQTARPRAQSFLRAYAPEITEEAGCIVDEAVKKAEVKLLGWSDEEANQALAQASLGFEHGGHDMQEKTSDRYLLHLAAWLDAMEELNFDCSAEESKAQHHPPKIERITRETVLGHPLLAPRLAEIYDKARARNPTLPAKFEKFVNDTLDGERGSQLIARGRVKWQKALTDGLSEARAKAWQRSARKHDKDRVKEMAGEWIVEEPPWWTHFQRPCWRIAMRLRYGLEVNPAIGLNLAKRCLCQKLDGSFCLEILDVCGYHAQTCKVEGSLIHRHDTVRDGLIPELKRYVTSVKTEQFIYELAQFNPDTGTTTEARMDIIAEMPELRAMLDVRVFLPANPTAANCKWKSTRANETEKHDRYVTHADGRRCSNMKLYAAVVNTYGKVGQEFVDFCAVIDNSSRGKGRGRNLTNLLSLLGVYANAEQVLLTHAPSMKRAQRGDVKAAIAAKEAQEAAAATAKAAKVAQAAAAAQLKVPSKVRKGLDIRGDVYTDAGAKKVWCLKCKKGINYSGWSTHCSEHHPVQSSDVDKLGKVDDDDDGVRKDDDTGQLKCSDAGLLCAGISDAVSTQKEAKAAAPGRRQKATSGDKGAKKARVAPKGK